MISEANPPTLVHNVRRNSYTMEEWLHFVETFSPYLFHGLFERFVVGTNDDGSDHVVDLRPYGK